MVVCVNNYDYPEDHDCHASVEKDGITSVINMQEHNTKKDEYIIIYSRSVPVWSQELSFSCALCV